MKSTRTTVTITLSEGAIDALKVLSMVDMRSKSQEIEYLIIDAVERRNLSRDQNMPKIIKQNNDDNLVGNYYVGVPQDEL